MAKQPDDKQREPDRLKIDGDWEDAAERLLHTPPESIPVREVQPRKKPEKPKPEQGE